MKKALSLVLALAMVLSMAVVGFAAKVDEVNFSATVTDAKKSEDGTKYLIDVTLTNVGDDVKEFAVDAAVNSRDNVVGTVEFVNAQTTKWTISVPVENTNVIYVLVDALDENGAFIEQAIYTQRYVAPAEVQDEVVRALEEAYDRHLTKAVINANALEDQTLTTADWKYITNTYKNGWDNWDHNYLGSEIVVELDMGGNYGKTIYTIGVVDYTWTKDVDFTLTPGGVTEEQYNLIRKMTGDTKNPLVFGFDGMACPDLTVDMVIPQQWINYYGHKNLTLFAWQEPITAIVENGPDTGKQITLKDAKVLTKTTLDVNSTVTQRIQFETDYLYEVLVLSATGVKDTSNTNNGGNNTDKKDSNPNTGANDIVNVAVVFAVVSLAAAGAFVCKKSK